MKNELFMEVLSMSDLTIFVLMILAVIAIGFIVKLLGKLFVKQLELMLRYWWVFLLIIIAIVVICVSTDILSFIVNLFG